MINSLVFLLSWLLKSRTNPWICKGELPFQHVTTHRCILNISWWTHEKRRKKTGLPAKSIPPATKSPQISTSRSLHAKTVALELKGHVRLRLWWSVRRWLSLLSRSSSTVGLHLPFPIWIRCLVPERPPQQSMAASAPYDFYFACLLIR